MTLRDWDVFCRVIDNYGDAGVCWRLCKDLAARGHRVRLWIDDARPLQWMGPASAFEAIDVRGWDDASHDFSGVTGGVVIEAFGCELPDTVKARMAAITPPPHWINLEYLSAEDYVERSHGLRSPQWQGPAAGLEKFFFYPGFTPRTGGLLREPGVVERLQAANEVAWLQQLGVERHTGERLVSLFCYDNPALPALLQALAIEPTLMLACPGPGSRALRALEAAGSLPADLRVHHLPFLTQDDFDQLLAACDLNLVRGEDSFVRAQWAGRPFIWHIYPQDDGAHEAKLEAFMSLAFAGFEEPLRADWRRLWRGWNGFEPLAPELREAHGAVSPPALRAAQTALRAWREALQTQPDLVTQLMDFIAR